MNKWFFVTLTNHVLLFVPPQSDNVFALDQLNEKGLFLVNTFQIRDKSSDISATIAIFETREEK